MKKSSVVTIALSLCTVAAVFVFTAVTAVRTKNARQSVVSNESPFVPELSVDNSQNESVSEKKEAKGVSVVAPDDYSSEENEIETSYVPAEEKEEYYEPVSGGKIINEFSDTALVFQATYGDYRTHLGIDIEAEENTPVVSIRDGVVIKSEADPEEGYVVEIEHKDGVVSVYKNLTTNELSPVGKVVDAGETIGAVGTSGIFESHLNPHLHFEVHEDNVEINPREYIK